MKIDFEKGNSLVPAIVQDSKTNKVLMLGYMNNEAYEKTQTEGRATFFSRSKNKIWTKGETSGNFLNVEQILVDCDNDTLLIKATPKGPICHTGEDTCFKEENVPDENFLFHLENVILDRKFNPSENSYTSSLFEKGINRIAQKVGEEATELVIDSIANDKSRIKEEAADLIFHLLVLLAAKDIRLDEIVEVLEKRHNK